MPKLTEYGIMVYLLNCMVKFLFFTGDYSRNSNAVVMWNGKISSSFSISRGTKQGSILSPLLFNIFIEELLLELNSVTRGLESGEICTTLLLMPTMLQLWLPLFL